MTQDNIQNDGLENKENTTFKKLKQEIKDQYSQWGMISQGSKSLVNKVNQIESFDDKYKKMLIADVTKIHKKTHRDLIKTGIHNCYDILKKPVVHSAEQALASLILLTVGVSIGAAISLGVFTSLNYLTHGNIDYTHNNLFDVKTRHVSGIDGVFSYSTIDIDNSKIELSQHKFSGPNNNYIDTNKDGLVDKIVVGGQYPVRSAPIPSKTYSRDILADSSTIMFEKADKLYQSKLKRFDLIDEIVK